MKKKFVLPMTFMAGLSTNLAKADAARDQYRDQVYEEANSRKFVCTAVYKSYFTNRIKEIAKVYVDLDKMTMRVTSNKKSGGMSLNLSFEIVKIEQEEPDKLKLYSRHTDTETNEEFDTLAYILDTKAKVIRHVGGYAHGMGWRTPVWSSSKARCKEQ